MKNQEISPNIAKEVTDRIAVVTKTYYSPRKFNIGVQYWTKEMIETGFSINTDRTKSTFVKVL